MPTSQPRSARLSWIAFGWFVAAIVTALAVFVLIALRLVGPAPDAASGWIVAAFAAGFFAGGYFVALRGRASPLADGIALALCSLAVWLAVNLVFSPAAGGWQALSLSGTALLLAVQAVAAALGAWLARRNRSAAGTGEVDHLDHARPRADKRGRER